MNEANLATRFKSLSLFLGPLVFLLFAVTSPSEGLSSDGWLVAGVTLWMAFWWLSEAVPIPVTSMIPLLIFPLLGLIKMGDISTVYAHPLIFMFLGGFLIAQAMQTWNLHRRIALGIMLKVGVSPVRLVIGLMAATAFLSMWISNTATTMMMMPIVLSIAQLVEGDNKNGNFTICCLLAVAYSASIGGMATLIGTPPNALLAGFLSKTYGYDLGFAQWMQVGVPVSLVMLVVVGFVLTRVLFPFKQGAYEIPQGYATRELDQLGPIAREEKGVLVVFILVVAGWLLRPQLAAWLPGAHISDASIALLGAFALFVIPTHSVKQPCLLDWKQASNVPWGVLLLFGGGMSLAKMINDSGLALWMGEGLSISTHWPVLGVVLLICAALIFMTELTSNTATAATFLPVIGAMAIANGENPLLLVVPMAMAVSCAFMMPVATPPNAIVFGSGKLVIADMARAGLLLNLIAIFVVSLLGYWLLLNCFDIQPGQLPAWLNADLNG